MSILPHHFPHLPPLVALLIFGLIVTSVRAATVVWTNLAGGTWATAANWSPNQVPAAADDAYITNQATFTVTVGATASVSNFFLGCGPGVLSNRLDQNAVFTVHGMARVVSNGWFRMSAQLNLSNRFENAGAFQWLDSPIRGNGTFYNATNGTMQTRSAGVSTIGIPVFDNAGYFLVGSDDAGVQLASNAVFTNEPSGDVQLGLPCGGIQNVSGATGTLFVNRGLVRATASSSSCPSYLTADLLNFGTLRQQTGLWYVGAGTNYGQIEATSTSHAFSTVSTDPFVLETGTTFGSIAPKLYAGGYLMVNAPLVITNVDIHVGDGSAGATVGTPKLTVNTDVTVSGDVDITVGRIELINPASHVFFGSLHIADSGVVGESRTITNAADLTVNAFQQNTATADNSGTLTIRTNWAFTGGTLRTTNGVVVLTTNSSSTFSGSGTKTVSGQIITNRGTVAATATVTFANGAKWYNQPGSVLNANGGSLDDNGTAGFFLNQGTVQRTTSATSGGVDLILTNAGGLVNLQNGTLAIGRAYQTSGRTELRGGSLSGSLTLLGGTLDGAGDVGTLINAADVLPGNPFGTIRATTAFTNLAGGTYHLQISGSSSNQYDHVTATGPVSLAGTLNVTFTNGFFPVIGNTYTAMTWTARSGVFSQILTPSYEFEVLYTTNHLLLRASNALPAITLSVTGGNTQLVCRSFTLTASGSDLDGSVTNIEFSLNGTVIGTNAGATGTAAAEIDFPGTNLFVARAIDNRGGSGWTTQQVVQATLSLHELMLGGKRTNDFKICMLGQSGSNYVLYGTTNFDVPVTNWTNLGLMENTNGIWRYLDNGTITNRQYRFYKAKQQ